MENVDAEISMEIGVLMFSMEFHGKCPNPPCKYFPWISMEVFHTGIMYNSCLVAQLNSSAHLSLLDLEGYVFACCLLVLICSFLFCLYRYECGLSCKLPSDSFRIITNSGRIRNR